MNWTGLNPGARGRAQGSASRGGFREQTNNKFRFAGKHGYQTDDGTGLDMLGARFYAPALGRFLTRDPIGHSGGLNLYAYCDNNPLVRVDPDGTDFLQFVKDLSKSVTIGFKGLKDHAVGWIDGVDAGLGFIYGAGKSVNHYRGEQDVHVRNIKNSAIGRKIESAVADAKYLRNSRAKLTIKIGTKEAAFNTLVDFSNGTQAQVGAVTAYVERSGDMINVYVYNKIGFNSFALHIPEKVGMKDWERTTLGNYGNVYQHYYWSYQVPKGK